MIMQRYDGLKVGPRQIPMYPVQYMKSKNFLSLELRIPVAQPGLTQIKKTRRFLKDLVISAKTRLSRIFRAQMPSQGASSKFGLCLSGLNT